MGRLNLSEWALRHKSLVWYFMIASTIAGVMSYINLGREEDPAFTIKTMIVKAGWPGASGSTGACSLVTSSCSGSSIPPSGRAFPHP